MFLTNCSSIFTLRNQNYYCRQIFLQAKLVSLVKAKEMAWSGKFSPTLVNLYHLFEGASLMKNGPCAVKLLCINQLILVTAESLSQFIHLRIPRHCIYNLDLSWKLLKLLLIFHQSNYYTRFKSIICFCLFYSPVKFVSQSPMILKRMASQSIYVILDPN